MKMKNKLPKTVFVDRVDEGTADEYLRVNEMEADAISEVGQKVRLGVYKLVGYVEVENFNTVK